jgi:hypothetical protein
MLKPQDSANHFIYTASKCIIFVALNLEIKFMKMLKSVGLLMMVALFIATSFTIAQEDQEITEKKEKKSFEGARPDLPGVLGLDLGFVWAPDLPNDMSSKLWPSIYFRGYYKWDLWLGKSNFSIHPGISVTSEKYTFKENRSFASVPGADGYETVLVDLDTILPADADIKRSQFHAVYLGIPLEITYNTNREYPKKSFKITAGVNFDFRVDAKTRVRYKQDDQNKKSKQKENYDTAWWRVNLTGRFQYASIGVFYNYSLTQLFEGDNGPLGTTTQPMSFGISFDLF